MLEEKQKLKSTQELDFVEIVEDQKPQNDKESEANSNVSDYVFFCKDCKEVIEPIVDIFRWKKWHKCKICWSLRVVSWTERSLKKYFRVK